MPERAILKMWVTEPPDPAVRKTLDRLIRAPDVKHVAVMPDVHLAAGVSNGVVVATQRLVYPAAVGGDIGCGFGTVALKGNAALLKHRATAETVLESLPVAVPVMRHNRRNGLPDYPDGLAVDRLSTPSLAGHAESEGRLELGTLGRGNHFLEIQEDDQGVPWLMVHSGSRAMGQHITNHHIRSATSAGGGLA